MNKKDMFIREMLQQDKEISNRAEKIFDNIKEEFKLDNNEKKVIKISFNTFLAIAACLVIVGFVGINIYANSLGKPNIISGIQALIKDEPKVNVDEIAKELFEKAVLAIREPSEFYKQSDSEEIKNIDNRYFKKTDSKYSEVKEKCREIFTEEALENVLKLYFYDVDGIAYAIPTAGPGYSIENINVEKTNEDNGELTYKATYTKKYVDGAPTEEQNCEFKIKKVDETYKIFATSYMNLDKIEENKGDTVNGKLDNELAKTKIQSYLNILGASQGSPAATLSTYEIDLIDRNSEIPGGDYIDKDNYRSSSINYEEFKNKMLEYMSEDLFTERFMGYKNVNGKLYIFDGGGTGMEFDVLEVKLITSDEISFKYEVKGIEYPPEEGMNFVAEVQLEKNENNKYVVSGLKWKESTELDDETAKRIIQGYFNIRGAKEGSPAEALAIEEIKLINSSSEILDEDYRDEDGYIKTNIEYKDFKNKMLQYMNKDLFEKHFSYGYKNVNGKLYVFDGGGTGIKMDISGIELISSDENGYKYKVEGIEYPPEEGMNFVAEIQLQRDDKGQCTVSSCEWK